MGFRWLSKKKIALFYPENEKQDIGFFQIVEGIQSANKKLHAEIKQYAFSPDNINSLAAELIKNHTDAVLFTEILPEDILNLFIEKNIILVAIRNQIDHEKISYVHYDTKRIGEKTAEYFISRECKMVALLLGPLAYDSGIKRSAYYIKQGFEDIVKQNGITDMKVHFSHGKWDRDVSDEAIDLMNRDFTCFFSASQYFTDTVSGAVHMKHLKIPQDIKLMGIATKGVVYPFSNMGVPFRELGEKAVELVQELAKNRNLPAQKILLTPEISTIGEIHF